MAALSLPAKGYTNWSARRTTNQTNGVPSRQVDELELRQRLIRRMQIIAQERFGEVADDTTPEDLQYTMRLAAQIMKNNEIEQGAVERTLPKAVQNELLNATEEELPRIIERIFVEHPDWILRMEGIPIHRYETDPVTRLAVKAGNERLRNEERRGMEKDSKIEGLERELTLQQQQVSRAHGMTITAAAIAAAGGALIGQWVGMIRAEGIRRKRIQERRKRK